MESNAVQLLGTMARLDNNCQGPKLVVVSNVPKTTLNISLPKPLKDFVEQQTALAGYTSASEFIRELIRAARQRRAHEHRLETLLLEGIDSGNCIEADNDYWTAKAAKLRARWADLDAE